METVDIAPTFAALIGLDEWRLELGRDGVQREEDYDVDAQMAFDKACVTGCKGLPEEASAAVGAKLSEPAHVGKLKSMIGAIQKHF